MTSALRSTRELDGYRVIAIKNRDRVELRSRNNKDLTAAYQAASQETKSDTAGVNAN